MIKGIVMTFSFARALVRTWLSVALAVCVFSSGLAAAQTSGLVVPGDLLKRRDYQTRNGITFAVDSAGSDSNSCVGVGQTCASINRIIRATPMRVATNYAIDVDAGTFNAPIAISGLYSVSIDGGSGAGSILIRGSQVWTNVTGLAGGTATGTLTSYAAAGTTNPTAATACDTTQSWVDGGLKGYFYTPTSGSVSSVTGKVPIIDNTTTCVRFVADPGAIVAGNTYAIQTPSTILTTPLTATLFTMRNTQVPVTLQDVEIQCTSVLGAVLLNQISSGLLTTSLTLSRVRLNCPATAAVFSSTLSTNISLSRVAVLGAGGSALSLQSGSGTLTAVYVKGSTAASPTITINQGDWTLNGVAAETQTSVSGNAPPISFGFSSVGSTNIASFDLRVMCPSTGTPAQPGVYAFGPTAVVWPVTNLSFAFNRLASENCAQIVLASGANTFLHALGNGGGISQSYAPGSGSGFVLSRGAQLSMPAGITYNLPWAGVTNQFTIDGTGYTSAQLSGQGAIRNLVTNTAVME